MYTQSLHLLSCSLEADLQRHKMEVFSVDQTRRNKHTLWWRNYILDMIFTCVPWQVFNNFFITYMYYLRKIMIKNIWLTSSKISYRLGMSDWWLYGKSTLCLSWGLYTATTTTHNMIIYILYSYRSNYCVNVVNHTIHTPL